MVETPACDDQKAGRTSGPVVSTQHPSSGGRPQRGYAPRRRVEGRAYQSNVWACRGRECRSIGAVIGRRRYREAMGSASCAHEFLTLDQSTIANQRSKNAPIQRLHRVEQTSVLWIDELDNPNQ
jgi:hypothetical protein